MEMLFGESLRRMRIMCALGCHPKGLGAVGRYFFKIIIIIIFTHFKGDMNIALLIQI